MRQQDIEFIFKGQQPSYTQTLILYNGRKAFTFNDRKKQATKKKCAKNSCVQKLKKKILKDTKVDLMNRNI